MITRRRLVLYTWTVIGVAIPLTAGWILTLVGFRLLEASPLLFGLGLVYAWSARPLLRFLLRVMW